MGEKSLGITIPREICELLRLDDNKDKIVRIQIDDANNDMENKDVLEVKLNWKKWVGGSVYDD